MEYYIITFNNTHGAIKAEKTIENTDIKFEIMPTPTEITRSCGICIRFSKKDIKSILELVDKDKIQKKDIFRMSDGSYIKVVKNSSNLKDV